MRMSTFFFKELFGGGQPQRRVIKVRVATDAQGAIVFQPLEGQAHVISDENSLDTVELDFDVYLDGCLCNAKGKTATVKCGEPGCGRVVCEKHAQLCVSCSKPLCLQHLHWFVHESAQRVPVCPVHYCELTRRHRWFRIARTMLQPFVTFDGPDSAK
jgi:hypothetical protein